MSCVTCKDKCKYNDVPETCSNCVHDYELVDKNPDPCDSCFCGSNFEYKITDE